MLGLGESSQCYREGNRHADGDVDPGIYVLHEEQNEDRNHWQQ